MSFVKQIFYVNAFLTLIDKVTVFEVMRLVKTFSRHSFQPGK